METDIIRPNKLYRYSEKKWLERSLTLGEFRLRPASDYNTVENDTARQDNELLRIRKSPASSIIIENVRTGERTRPIGDVVYRSETGTNYLTICFSKQWDLQLFKVFSGTDSCLVVHNVEEFSERLHLAVEKKLIEWVGMDASIVYGGNSELGAVFSKPLHYIFQHEWRFAWSPITPVTNLEPLTVSIGNIENIAEIIES